LTLGLRPLGLSPGSQGSADALNGKIGVVEVSAPPAAAAAEIAGERGPGVKSIMRA